MITSAWLANCKDERCAALLREYEGQHVCGRCSRPDKEELNAGVLRFSAANFAFPVLPPIEQTPFADAWEAEVALVRVTLPCVEIKVLKHGGTLSKTHSVSVALQENSTQSARVV